MNLEDIEFKLFIGQFHTMKQLGEFNDVVTGIEYTYSGFFRNKVDGVLYSHGITKAISTLRAIEDLNSDGYIDFNDISQETALSWIMAELSEQEIEQMKIMIKNKIEFDMNLSVRNAPWVTITEGVPAPDQEVKK